MERLKILCLVLTLVCLAGSAAYAKEEFPINIAVEFTDHATSFYVAQRKGWFEEEGLKPTSYSYVTGMALASALGRGDIQAAYMCLLPAITAYANARVPIKVVAGLHRHGYGLAVDPAKIKTVADLEKPGIRIGCNKAGGPADAIIHKTIEKYNLDRDKILNKIQRMNPATQILAIRMGKLDAFFNCEHWPAMAEDAGFKMLLTSQEVWPNMQGSVLIVREDLIKNHPEVVRKLVAITGRAIEWIKKNPREAASIMSKQLQMAGGRNSPSDAPEGTQKLKVTPETVLRSMTRIEHSFTIDPAEVQRSIDFAKKHGNIRNDFKASDILDLRFSR
ncbi:MAG TPA: ABC transporter substrate-binding protein [Deltaproteobacteria bacterium]|nr:ABC transporter substrate-binding protein [Deltaproteobacteria bacterium]